MKTFVLIFLSVLVCSPLFAVEKGLSPIGEAFSKAFEANDLEAIMALYAPDAHLFPPDAMEAVGTDAIRASYAALLNTYKVQEIKILDAHHEIIGDLSFGWGKFSALFVPKAGGDPVRMEGRYSDVSRKINGKWLYIQDHASVPMPPPPTPAK